MTIADPKHMTPGTVIEHKTGGFATLDRRKDDDTGWWMTDGGGLADSIAAHDWSVSQFAPVEHAEWPPRFQFASDVWPGLAKLVEECGELVQVGAKIIGTAGTMQFRDGSRVERQAFLDELADVAAIVAFTRRYGLTDYERYTVTVRSNEKFELFETWRKAEREDRP